jgi:hypothetical protein
MKAYLLVESQSAEATDLIAKASQLFFAAGGSHLTRNHSNGTPIAISWNTNWYGSQTKFNKQS